MSEHKMEFPEFSQKLETDVLSVMKKPGKVYWFGLGFAILGFFLYIGVWSYQIAMGLGVAGIMNPVGWGVFLADFVFWVGIAHSGTLISAVLFLFRAKFRNAFNRTAEAMTVFAIIVAGLFPIIHLGRPWFFYWLLPYPNQRLLWTNFRSPLTWDVFAVSTYFLVSAVFFLVGLIPDLAIVARKSTGLRSRIYRILSLGWKGTSEQWRHYVQLYFFLAAFATPLVISVHSVVSWDFSVSIVPGWHTTIFAPYFVAGAIFSGIAMVITLMVPMRKILLLESYITVDHFEKLAKILLFMSMIVSYAYLVELGIAFYSGNIFESEIFKYRMTGHYKVFYWIMFTCNSILPISLFFKKLRRNLTFLFILSLFINVGMWCERFVIVITSLAREYLPYAWGTYTPSLVEIGMTLGSFAFFFMLFLAFIKLLPVLSITELKEESH